MVRTQIYLREDEHQVLRGVSYETGESVSAIIRHAVDVFIQNRTVKQKSQLAQLKRICGVWSEKEAQVSRKVRKEFDRFPV